MTALVAGRKLLMFETVEEKPGVLVLEDDLMFSVHIERTLTHLG